MGHAPAPWVPRGVSKRLHAVQPRDSSTTSISSSASAGPQQRRLFRQDAARGNEEVVHVLDDRAGEGPGALRGWAGGVRWWAPGSNQCRQQVVPSDAIRRMSKEGGRLPLVFLV